MAKKYSRIVRKIAQTLVYFNVRPTYWESVIDPTLQEYVQQPVELPEIIERALKGETIKKSRVEQLEKYEEEYFNEFIPLREKAQRLQEMIKLENENTWFSKLCKEIVRTNDLKKKLWAAEQEVHDLKYERNRDQNYFEDFGAAKEDVISEQQTQIAKQNDTIDDFIEENLNLHHELILQRDCNRMAHEVVHIVNEWHKPAEQIEPPKCLKPLDALNWSGRYVSAVDWSWN